MLFRICLLLPLLCRLQMEASGATAQTSLPVEHAGPVFQNRAKADQVILEFMEKYRVPGLSAGFSRSNRLVYAGAFGWSDARRRQPLKLQQRMRIASCSKPLTSLTILRLKEAGKLSSLDSPVFGENGLLGMDYGVPKMDGKPAVITVRHLLQHTSGGWGNKKSDPMFAFHRHQLDEILKKTLRERELHHAPGTQYEYSNFGYAVLGRVIEKITGTNYEAAVREWVLAPCGAGTMRMAAAKGADPSPDEVQYLGDGSEDPYYVRPEIMQAHGGWAATPLELLNVLDRVDGKGEWPEILSPASLREMTQPALPGSRYALGWSVNQANNWWHMGSLPGTGTVMVRTEAGCNWAILCNTRSAKEGFMSDLDQLGWRVLRFLPDTPPETNEVQ